MTWPRYVPSESYCFVTRRCAQRKFLLKPSKAGNRAFEYCLAWAAHKTGVQVLCSVVLSNHYHLGLYDPEGRVSEFMRELNRLVAKHHNTMYRRRENLFSSDKFSKVLLESAIDVVRRLVYTLDNPVKAELVDTARHWPGVISLPEHLATTKTVKRPPLFFRENGHMPKTLELTYHKPQLQPIGGIETLQQTLLVPYSNPTRSAVPMTPTVTSPAPLEIEFVPPRHRLRP
jgi:putative transposase